MKTYSCDKCGKSIESDNVREVVVYFNWGAPRSNGVTIGEYCNWCCDEMENFIKPASLSPSPSPESSLPQHKE